VAGHVLTFVLNFEGKCIQTREMSRNSDIWMGNSLHFLLVEHAFFVD
jgi:hypothetical protein